VNNFASYFYKRLISLSGGLVEMNALRDQSGGFAVNIQFKIDESIIVTDKYGAVFAKNSAGHGLQRRIPRIDGTKCVNSQFSFVSLLDGAKRLSNRRQSRV